MVVPLRNSNACPDNPCTCVASFDIKLDTSPFTLSNSNVLKLNLGQFEEHSHYFCPAPNVEVVKSVAGHLLSPV